MRTVTRILSFILGLCTIITGIYCLLTPDVALNLLAIIIGVVMIADAIIKIFSWISLRDTIEGDSILLFSAIISAILGIFLVADGFVQWMLESIIVYVSAAWVIVMGILRISRAFKLKNLTGNAATLIGRYWWVLLIFGIALTILGIFMFLNPMTVAWAIGIIISIAVIFVGANLLTFSIA
ncbi:DUF308 domain-containing protein [Candidatus Saccharibacteria bacterium]|nr:DUF308 domain-containing protein [Candidatus Saccharibacteria bacterium]